MALHWLNSRHTLPIIVELFADISARIIRYNEDVKGVAIPWDENDYQTANNSMRHEAAMLQTHPSILAYLVGSDYWPDDKAAAMYVERLNEAGWQNPIICSAAKRGYPEILGPSGLKM